MATNLALDNSLILEAQEIGKFKTKKETVNYVLREYIQRHKQMKIAELFGKIDFDEDYNYKENRN